MPATDFHKHSCFFTAHEAQLTNPLFVVRLPDPINRDACCEPEVGAHLQVSGMHRILAGQYGTVSSLMLALLHRGHLALQMVGLLLRDLGEGTTHVATSWTYIGAASSSRIPQLGFYVGYGDWLSRSILLM